MDLRSANSGSHGRCRATRQSIWSDMPGMRVQNRLAPSPREATVTFRVCEARRGCVERPGELLRFLFLPGNEGMNARSGNRDSLMQQRYRLSQHPLLLRQRQPFQPACRKLLRRAVTSRPRTTADPLLACSRNKLLLLRHQPRPAQLGLLNLCCALAVPVGGMRRAAVRMGSCKAAADGLQHPKTLRNLPPRRRLRRRRNRRHSAAAVPR